MKSRRTKLLSVSVAPVFAAAGIALGAGAVSAAPASGDCAWKSAGAELPAAKAHTGEVVLAASCNPCNPCAAKDNPCEANPCSAANPCGAAENPCNPCSAEPKQ